MADYLERARIESSESSGTAGGLAAERQGRGHGDILDIGLVNNMPDSALIATERQFIRHIEALSRGRVRLHLYYLPELPRGAEARAVLAARYRPVEQLYAQGLDGLIVTGNEPRASKLSDEPYWPALTRLVDWARDNSGAAIWSCLAAHAAVLHLDGIARRPLASKRSGLFVSKPQAGGYHGYPTRLSICHSRLNEVRHGDLSAAGYDILTASAGGHVDIFAKTYRSRFVFFQGHPEYDADSLMREYRRDVGRYLSGEREVYPEMPENYFDAETSRRMGELRAAAEACREPALIQTFPKPRLRAGLARRMQISASSVFGQWLEVVERQRLLL